MQAHDHIRARIARGECVPNGWLTLGSGLAAELTAAAGWPLLTIDQQHGLGGNAELVACLTGAKAGGAAAFVRVADNDFGLIGRALDAGAQGIVCPMVNSRADAERLVAAVKYPPLGARSWGPYRAKLLGVEETAAANAWTIACAQIETAEALANLDAILATPGLDMILAGPNDLSITLSNGKSRDIRDAAVAAALDAILPRAKAAGVIAGIFANDADFARPLIAGGWQVVTVGVDAGWLSAGASAALEPFRG